MQLGINPDRDISGVILDKYKFNEAVHKVKNTNFELLAGKSGSGFLASLDISNLNYLKNEIIHLIIVLESSTLTTTPTMAT